MTVRHDAVQMYRLDGDAAPLVQSALLRPQQRRASLLSQPLVKPLARSMQSLARTLVSGNKNRFTEVGASAPPPLSGPHCPACINRMGCGV